MPLTGVSQKKLRGEHAEFLLPPKPSIYKAFRVLRGQKRLKTAISAQKHAEFLRGLFACQPLSYSHEVATPYRTGTNGQDKRDSRVSKQQEAMSREYTLCLMLPAVQKVIDGRHQHE